MVGGQERQSWSPAGRVHVGHGASVWILQSTLSAKDIGRRRGKAGVGLHSGRSSARGIKAHDGKMTGRCTCRNRSPPGPGSGKGLPMSSSPQTEKKIS